MRLLVMLSLVLASAALVGCMKDTDNPNSGGGGGPGNFDQKSAANETQGLFVTQATAPLENGAVPQAMQLPAPTVCANVPDTDKMKFGFDPRLQLGDVFVHATAGTDLDSGFSMTNTASVGTLDGTTMVLNSSITNMTMSPAPPVQIPSTVSVRETCTKSADGQFPDCKFEVLTPIPGPPNGTDTTVTCSIDMSGPTDITGTAERGTYTLKSGTTVQALRVTETYPVHIKCHKGSQPDTDYGAGTAQSTAITSNDAVSQNPFACSFVSNTLYSYLGYAQTGGTLISSYKDEVLATPVR